MNLYLFVLLLAVSVELVCAEHKWYYTFVSLDTDVKQSNWIDTSNLNVARIKRGDYAINGTIEVLQDIGVKFKFNMKTYRSPRGNDDYKPMPWSVDKQDFSEFFNGVYKKVVMEDLGKCSSAPHFEDEWDGLIKQGTIEFNMCKIDTAGWPEDLMEGYYKLVMDINDMDDEPVGTIEVVVQVEKKS